MTTLTSPDIPDIPDVPDVPDIEYEVLPYLEGDGISYVETDISLSSEFYIINTLYGKIPDSTPSGNVFTFHNGDANFCMVGPSGVNGVAARRPATSGTNVIVEHDKVSSIQSASYIILTLYMDNSQGYGSYYSTFTSPLNTETLPSGSTRCQKNYLESPAAYSDNVYMRILGNKTGTPASGGLKFVRTTIKKSNGELLHDLIPVKLDGQLGVIDKITNRFYPFVKHE